VKGFLLEVEKMNTENNNPYETSVSNNPSNAGAFAHQQSGGAVSGAVIDQLRRTQGWARFLGILGFITCGFMILGGIGLALMGSAMGSAMGESKGFGVLMSMVYIVMAAFYFYPSFKLNQYASRIGKMVQQPTEENLVSALDSQRVFWKFVGIIMMVTLILYVLVIIGAIILGAAGAVGGR
jgi:hypothetical protein